MVRLSHAGAAIEPKAVALWMALSHALDEAQLPDLFDTIRPQVLAFGQALVRDRTDPTRHVWRLSEWGELTLTELLALATSDLPAPRKHEALLGAIALAGYDRTEQTT